MARLLKYLAERWRLYWADLDTESGEGKSAQAYEKLVREKIRAGCGEPAQVEELREAGRP